MPPVQTPENAQERHHAKAMPLPQLGLLHHMLERSLYLHLLDLTLPTHAADHDEHLLRIVSCGVSEWPKTRHDHLLRELVHGTFHHPRTKANKVH